MMKFQTRNQTALHRDTIGSPPYALCQFKSQTQQTVGVLKPEKQIERSIRYIQKNQTSLKRQISTVYGNFRQFIHENQCTMVYGFIRTEIRKYRIRKNHGTIK